MKISIAMTTYNGEQYIQEQLDSFLDQTKKPDELIISDDCSTDQTIPITENFKNKTNFEVKIIKNKKNLGYAGNFSRALSAATGDLILLADQDDFWFPNKIHHIYNKALKASKTNEILLIINNCEITDENLSLQQSFYFESIKEDKYFNFDTVLGCCMAASRELIDLCTPIPEGIIAHDRWISDIALLFGEKIVINSPLQYYRRHNNTATTSKNQNKKTQKKERIDFFNEKTTHYEKVQEKAKCASSKTGNIANKKATKILKELSDEYRTRKISTILTGLKKLTLIAQNTSFYTNYRQSKIKKIFSDIIH